MIEEICSGGGGGTAVLGGGGGAPPPDAHAAYAGLHCGPMSTVSHQSTVQFDFALSVHKFH
jgi:hypothetical protein